MQKIIKVDKTIIAILSNGMTYQKDDLTEEEINTIMNTDSEEEIISIMNPEYKKEKDEYNRAIAVENRINRSKILTKEGDSVYWEEVSHLSMPMELIDVVLGAEVADDKLKLETYKNFWTLMSLNPSEECRKNLFWFLNRNGLVISRCGFFVAYRNANLKFIDTDGKKVFTDAHSGKTRIKIGEVVSIPRESCDCDSNVTCSRGLNM